MKVLAWILLSASALSGYEFLTPETQALQDDDFANPGMLWVEEGGALFREQCTGCHAVDAMRGVAARFPRIVEGELHTLDTQVRRCQVRVVQPPWALPDWETRPHLATTAWISHQSRGMPRDLEEYPTWLREGREEFEKRRGQLDIACMHCHERNAGRRLRDELISQGQINGFPIYRVSWETLGSVQQMFRWCNEQVRSEPHRYGHRNYRALEYYLAWRGRELPLESPAVRR